MLRNYINSYCPNNKSVDDHRLSRDRIMTNRGPCLVYICCYLTKVK